jgi:DNA polymerase-3 subunit delta
MTEINFFDLEKKITSLKKNSGVFYIYGDSYLCDEAKTKIIELLLSSDKNEFSVEKYDGNFKGIDEVLENVFTYSFFSDKKIVVYENPSFFETSNDKQKAFDKIKKSYSQNRLDLSASALIRMFASEFSEADSFYDELKDKIKAEFLKDQNDNSWIDQVISYAKENNVKPGGKKEESDIFLQWLDKEFPENNYLIIISSKTDKKRKIYKKINEKGEIINCLLPTGSRKADKDQREAAAKKIVSAELLKAGKNKGINSETINLLLEYSGDDLRTLVKNLDQVIIYSGSKKSISSEDVKNVLERTREDPVFAFTGAVAERNIDDALFYMYSLVSSGYHPLQILASLYNQFSNLLLASEFINNYSKNFQGKMNYNFFMDRVVPEIEDYDNDFLKKIEDLNIKKSKQDNNAYLISGTKKNYYPVYLLFNNCLKYKIDEFKNALIELGESDNEIKNGADPFKIIESFIFKVMIPKKEEA